MIPNIDPRDKCPPEFEARVQSVVRELLPRMRADGGGAEIVSVLPGAVTLKLIGVCLFCPSRPMTVKSIEDILKNKVPGLDTVTIIYPELCTAKPLVGLG